MKKYSEKFLNQSDLLKKAIVGLEFEFYVKDLSFYKTLEMLNIELAPVKVWGFRQYHSDFRPDEKNFKIEPDLSGGSNMIELVTGPMEYHDAKYYLIKIVKFIQNYGYTNEKSSIHFNISFKGDKDLNDLNILKLILNIDEEEIYRAFPTRKDNVYAKSIKKIIPYKDYDFFNVPIGSVKNSMRLPNDKYYGINFLHINESKEKQRLELRYIGGKDYEKNVGMLTYFMDKFIITTIESIDAPFTSEDINALEEYLESNIKTFKNFAKYDSFIVSFPTIQMQIDQNSNYDVVSAYYTNIYSDIYELIDATKDLKDCIINYVTETQTMEIVDARINTTGTIRGFTMLNCAAEGIFEGCIFTGCEIKNSQLTKSKISDSDITGSKVLNCRAEASSLKNCYFMNGFFNGDMSGGVFRSGELGPYAILDSDVKIVSDTENFFDTKFEEAPQKGEDKGIIPGFGKGGKK